MEKYEHYKDSGEKWLGQVPSHWEVKRLGSYFTERRVKVSDKDFAALSVTKKGIFPQLENVAKSNDSDNRKLVKTGDFVINSRSDRKGSSGVSPYDGSVSLINIVLKPRGGIMPAFCNYLLKNNAFVEEYYRNGRGIVADLWTTRYDEMKSIKLAIPTMGEQERMVSYLDEQCSKIDEAIAQQQKMIDLLNERKQIIINNAVTKGLNPNVAMKESGIKWVGHIPSSWQIRSLKRTAKVILGKMLENEYGNKKGYPYLCAKDVHFNSINTDNLKTMLFSEEERSKYKVQKGDLLVVEGGAGGTCAIVKDDINEVYIQNSLMIVRCNEQIATNSYLSYYLQMLMQKGYADSVCNKATIMHFTKEKLCDVPVILPSISQQKYIVEFLDNQLLKIDMVINSLEARKSLLTERKQIIINEVVTGKVKV